MSSYSIDVCSGVDDTYVAVGRTKKLFQTFFSN